MHHSNFFKIYNTFWHVGWSANGMANSLAKQGVEWVILAPIM